MKIRCKKAYLVAALQTVTGIAPQKDIYPILSNVKITVEKDDVVFRATDLKISLTFFLDSNKSEIFEEGEILVSAAKLYGIVKDTPDDKITIEKEGLNAKITVSDGVFKILGEDPEKFPAIPDFPQGESIEITGTDFQKLIKKTIFATTQERARYDLDNVLVQLNEKSLKFVATDGKRLAICERPCREHKLEIKTHTVPSKGLAHVERVISNTSADKVFLSVADNQLLVRTEDAILSTRLSESKFPPYQKVIPKDFPFKAVIRKPDLVSAIRRVAWCADDKNKSIELSFSKDKVCLFTCSDTMGESSLDMPVIFSGDPFQIKFNPDYLMDAIKAADSLELSIQLKDKSSAAFITEEDFQCVVLPIKPEPEQENVD